MLPGTYICQREQGESLGMKIGPRTTPPGKQLAYIVTMRAKEAAEASKEQEECSNKVKRGVNGE